MDGLTLVSTGFFLTNKVLLNTGVNKMKIIINYTDKEGVQTVIEFDNLKDAYSFTFDNICSSVEVVGDGVYSAEQFQTAHSNNEFNS